MAEPDITIAAMLGDIRRRLWLIIAVAITAAGLALILSSLQPERFEATTSLLFADVTEGAPERVAATNLALATLDSVVVRVQRTFSARFSLEELRNRVSVSPKGQADIVEIKAEGDTRRQALQLAEAFARQIVAVRVERAKAVRTRAIAAIAAQSAAADPASGLPSALARRKRELLVERALEDGGVSIAGEAFAPLQRSQPRPLRNAAVGGGAGLLFALLLALGLRERGREIDEVQAAGIVHGPVLARVPDRGRRSSWRLEAFLEAIQFLRTNLMRALKQADGARTVAITSPRPADGKSMMVEQLARAMAETGLAVIVVDADLRRGVLAGRFGAAPAGPGLVQALAEEPEGYLVQTAVTGVRLLTPGDGSEHYLTAVDPTSVRRLLDALRASADIVLIDTAPISIAAETSDIAAAVDAVVLVIDASKGDMASLHSAQAQLQRVEARVVGLVLNKSAGQQQKRDRAAYAAYGVRVAGRPARRWTNRWRRSPARPR